MVRYLLATGAIWITISVIFNIGHIAVSGSEYKNMPGLLEAPTRKRRLPLHYIGALAFALIFAYLLRMAWPAEVPLAGGVIFGLLIGLATYLPQLLNQVASFSYPAKIAIGSASIGVLQTTMAGLISGLIL